MASRSLLLALVVALGSSSLVSCPLVEWSGLTGVIGTAWAGAQSSAGVDVGRGTTPAPGAGKARSAPPPEGADSPGASPAQAGEWPEPSDGELSSLAADVLSVSIDPDRALAAIAPETIVREEPSFEGRKLGYLRAGAVVRREPEATSHHQCAEGWYRIEPRGYVCVGKTATLDLQHPVVTASRRRPDRRSPLPYLYGRSRFPTPPFYAKIPSPEEQLQAEYDLGRQLKCCKRGSWNHVPFEPVPEQLVGGGLVPSLQGLKHSPRTVYTGRAIADSGFAFLRFFESEGRRFGLSTDLAVMPLDRLKPVAASSFRGLELDDEITLPVVFVRSRRANLYRRDGEPPGVSLSIERRLSYREAVPITGKTARVKGKQYLETRGGKLIRNANLIRINPLQNRPSWAIPGRTWVDVSILGQTLVAYEGAKPVYVTLVSTGADGLGDPEETHSTVRGRFLVHTKHVTATMSGDEAGDEFDLRDVPYVQYFTEGYALHAAYWHDAFGVPRSHGCINLSPIDAHWLFRWTDPPVPEEWHAAMSLHHGTLVNVHP